MLSSPRCPRPRLPATRVSRSRALPNAGGYTLFFWCDLSPGRGSRAPGSLLEVWQVPEFEGEEAVFEYEKKKGRVVLGRRVE